MQKIEYPISTAKTSKARMNMIQKLFPFPLYFVRLAELDESTLVDFSGVAFFPRLEETN
jgi:hypothetical protein